MRSERLMAVVALCASIGAASELSHAQTACSSLTHPVIVSGSTAIKTLLQNIAPILAGAPGADQQTVVLALSGSCAGVAALAADTTPTGACATGACVTGTASYYTAGSTTPQMCNLDSAGTHIDLALSDVFPTSCAGVDTSSLGSTSTVVLPFGFIVPTASGQVAIDTREAYFVYGFGAAGNVTPWNNETFLFRRNQTSGTQITIARAIMVPETRFLGIDTGSTGTMIMDVASSSNAAVTIGFAGLDSADAHRDTLTELAYRHWGQNNYYWADSRHDVFDKRNIRDGHYPLWSYEQAVVLNGAGGTPVSAAGAQLAAVIAGSHVVTGLDMLHQTIATSLVPTCAMNVSRATDGGDFSLYTPPAPCSCYFDANVSGGSTSCTACTSDPMCATGQHCRFGYCENN